MRKAIHSTQSTRSTAHTACAAQHAQHRSAGEGLRATAAAATSGPGAVCSGAWGQQKAGWEYWGRDT